MDVLVVVLICLSASFIVKEIFKKFNLPEAIGQIVAGMILGLPFISKFIFDYSILSVVDFLSEIGIIFLLFLAGIHIDFKKLKETTKDATLIAMFSAAVPFVLGFAFIKLFGYSNIVALIFGIALSVTAEGTKTKVLMDLKALNTKLGTIMISAGAIDDIIELFGLAIVAALSQSTFKNLFYIPVNIIIFAILTFLMFRLIPRIAKYIKRETSQVNILTIMLILLLILAVISEMLEIGYLIGALIAGFLIQIAIKNFKGGYIKKSILSTFEITAMSFIIPFFFVNIGLTFGFKALVLDPYLLIGTVFIAIIGKILGTMAVKPFSSLSLKQLYLIGWAMNSRGAVELIIALTALKLKLIPAEVFSMLVITSILTTLMFPIILQKHIKEDPKIMDR